MLPVISLLISKAYMAPTDSSLINPLLRKPSRIASIDLIRGAVMILMALDHARVFSGLPTGGTIGLFITRWVTHFCAPAFIFLAGTSAFFYGRKHGKLSRFLLTRGVWLIFLELTFLRVAWTFNFAFDEYLLAGVIWVIGWCMILMAGLVKLPTSVIGILGLILITGHNVTDFVWDAFFAMASESSLSGLWKVLYLSFFAGPIQLGADGPNLIVLYSIIPWVGVMAAGYAFGAVLTLEPAQRNRLCLQIGLGAVVLFVVLRSIDVYGDPRPWRGMMERGLPALPAFLNTNKYPASLSFLLMTLGPTIALIPALEHARGAVARWITVFGQVPFFYYMLHIPLIHILAILVSTMRLGEVSPWLFANHPMGSPDPPVDYVWGLPVLYLVWGLSVILLYFASRWFADLKARRKGKDWWLSYL